MIQKLDKDSKRPHAVRLLILKSCSLVFSVDLRIRQHPETGLVNDLGWQEHTQVEFLAQNSTIRSSRTTTSVHGSVVKSDAGTRCTQVVAPKAHLQSSAKNRL